MEKNHRKQYDTSLLVLLLSWDPVILKVFSYPISSSHVEAGPDGQRQFHAGMERMFLLGLNH